MKKIQIAVFGISEGIWGGISNKIDPRRTEIVTFIENDKSKQGTSFMNIPIVALEQMDIKSVDYFLVAALSAYESIKQQLITFGVCKEKIQVFVTEQLCNYCVGSLDGIDLEFIKTIYFEPAKMISIVEKYQMLYKIYSQVPAFEDTVDDWFHKSNLISHACGGVVNGRHIMYSNSKEAFLYSMDCGFKIIECDVLGMANGELVLLHDYWRVYEAKAEHYTMLTAKEFLSLLKEYPDVNCLVDVKWDNYEEYNFSVNEIEKLIHNISGDGETSTILKSQIIMEVYDEPTIQIAKEHNFNMIFTQYRNPDKTCFMNTVNLCWKYDIKVVAFPFEPFFWEQKFLNIVTSKNIKVFAFSTDSLEDYFVLREKGIKGIFTNYLTEKDIDLKEA